MHTELHDFAGTGRSILELSHRSPEYDRVHEGARALLLRLLEVEADFDVLLMGGGARTQFSLVPMNLLRPGQRGDYLVTGRWSELALAAGEQAGAARCLWSGKKEGYRAVPQAIDYEIEGDATYLHYTSNNTIYGTQFPSAPEARGVPLAVDVSSDFLSRPFDLTGHALAYAGAQKNLGPAGVTVVVIRRELLEQTRTDLAPMFSYRAFATKRSLLNTPPVFAIYAMGLVLEDLEARGGLVAAGRRNREKSELLYRAIERSDGFYVGHAETASRSQMNVTFRIADNNLEPQFLEEAERRGLVGLKGHRSVGGIRASVYNGVELASVQELVALLDDFRSDARS
jgi:phosphoserine aminotransferase